MTQNAALQHAVRQLGGQHQVPLATDAGALLHPDGAGEYLHIRLGIPLRIEVESKDHSVLLRGDFERMDWRLYEVIAGGLRNLVAEQLKVQSDRLVLTKLLVVGANEATQYVEIAIPREHGSALLQAGNQAEVRQYVQVVQGQPVAGTCADGSSEPSRAARLAKEVRAAIGGKTLPAACTIALPGYNEPLVLAGRLGDKPDRPPTDPVPPTVIKALLDGYIKSKRHLLVLPLRADSDGAVNMKHEAQRAVVYDEEEWFDTIASLTASRGQVVSLTYQQSFLGHREVLTLIDLHAAESTVR